MVNTLRSRCEDAFTSSPGAAVIPFLSPPVIFPIPGDFPDPPGDKIISGIRMSGTRVAAGSMQTVMHCMWCVHGETPPCSYPCEHTHRQGIVLACRPVPVLAFLDACMHPENFSVEILKCRKKVEFTKSPHLLSGGSTSPRIHESELSFFPLSIVARRLTL